MAATKKAAADTFETWTAAYPDVWKDNYEKFAKSINELADFNRESAEAFAAAAGVVAKGFEKAAAEHNAFVKGVYEDGVAAARDAAASKSVQDSVEIHTQYVRATFEKNMGHMSMLADHWMAVSKQASEPLTARYGDLVEKVQAFRP